MPPARDGEFVDEDACDEAAGRDEGAVDLGLSQGGVGRHQLRPQPQQQLSVQPDDACNIVVVFSSCTLCRLNNNNKEDFYSAHLPHKAGA